jgi:predicted ATPase
MKSHLPLSRFCLENFKAVRDSGPIDFGPLTAFIGNNGSGKSSLIEGLDTFRTFVLDNLNAAMNAWRGIEHIRNKKAAIGKQRNGKKSSAAPKPIVFRLHGFRGKDEFRAESVITSRKEGDEILVQSETLEILDTTLRRNEDNQVVWEFKATKGDVRGTVPSWGSLHRDELGRWLSSWQFLELVPSAMGDPQPQTRTRGRIQLARNGSNIAEYLNEIRKLDEGAYKGVFEALQFVLPYAKDLQPALASELQREFYLTMKEENFEVPGWLLSTGTLRVLALLACLRHPKPPPLLVVEEIENGLDPRTLQLVVAEIRGAIEAGTTQVIVTTHSPYLLDQLHLSHIVVVEREDGEPKFHRPADDKELAKWAKEFSPGQLYTMGRLTRRNEA